MFCKSQVLVYPVKDPFPLHRRLQQTKESLFVVLVIGVEFDLDIDKTCAFPLGLNQLKQLLDVFQLELLSPEGAKNNVFINFERSLTGVLR